MYIYNISFIYIYITYIYIYVYIYHLNPCKKKKRELHAFALSSPPHHLGYPGSHPRRRVFAEIG